MIKIVNINGVVDVDSTELSDKVVADLATGWHGSW